MIRITFSVKDPDGQAHYQSLTGKSYAEIGGFADYMDAIYKDAFTVLCIRKLCDEEIKEYGYNKEER